MKRERLKVHLHFSLLSAEQTFALKVFIFCLRTKITLRLFCCCFALICSIWHSQWMLSNLHYKNFRLCCLFRFAHPAETTFLTIIKANQFIIKHWSCCFGGIRIISLPCLAAIDILHSKTLSNVVKSKHQTFAWHNSQLTRKLMKICLKMKLFSREESHRG